MAIIIKNTSNTKQIVDGIEIAANSSYILDPEDEANVLKSEELNTGLSVNNFSLSTSDNPSIFYSGVDAVKNIQKPIYSTDDVTEGNTNLYFTNARVANNAVIQNISQTVTNHTHNTDNVSEGLNNLYFTNLRVTNNPTVQNLVTHTHNSDNVTEGVSNLYFTNSRVANSAVVQGLSLTLNTHTHNSDNVTEGTNNLYFTDLRVSQHPELISLRDDLNSLSSSRNIFGNFSNGNYSNFDNFGILNFHGTARPIKQVIFNSENTKTIESTAPAYGVLQNTQTVNTSVNKAVVFQKQNKEYGVIPAHNKLTFHEHDFTLAFIIIPTEEDGYIICKENETWSVELKNSRIKVDVGKSGSLKSELKLNFNERNFVVVSFSNSKDKSKIRIYINNELDESKVFNNPIYDLDNKPIYIGAENPSGNWMDCVLDELRIWDCVLTSSEINAYYNSLQGTESYIAPNNTVACYHFNEVSGNIIHEESDSSLDMVLYSDQNTDLKRVDGLVLDNIITSKGVFANWFSGSKEQELFGTVLVPNSYEYGSPVSINMNVLANDIDSVYQAVWELETIIIDTNSTLSNTDIINLSVELTPSVQNTVISIDFPNIDFSSLTQNNLIKFRLTRKGNDVNDTFNKNIAFLSLIFNFTTNSI